MRRYSHHPKTQQKYKHHALSERLTDRPLRAHSLVWNWAYSLTWAQERVHQGSYFPCDNKWVLAEHADAQ